MSEHVKIIYNGNEYELSVIAGSEGERAIDISQLRASTGFITLDPGYANTGSCASNITFTVMFAIGRLPGWIAQWKESMDDPNWKLGRPRQIHTGPTLTKFVPVDER